MALNRKYQKLIENNTIKLDPAQAKIIEKLHFFGLQLIEKNNSNRNNFLDLFFNKKEHPIKNIYLYGGVGRGKSMLMDLFYELIEIDKKQRIHFHSFMKDIHDQLGDLRKNNDLDKKHLLHKIAKNYSSQYNLICLDELHITNVVDAMLVGNLFKYMIEENINFVITSNRRPDELYQDGLQRESFMDFIKLIIDKFDVCEIESAHDYRMHKIESIIDTYFYPLNEKNEKKIRHLFADLTDYGKISTKTIIADGREISLKDCFEDIVLLEFDDMCKQPLGANDYQKIATKFSIIFLTNIPKFIAEDRNEAKRFTNFIDVLYENKVLFICSAAVTPEKLYVSGDGNFEFQRTISRLNEMKSHDYIVNSKGNI